MYLQHTGRIKEHSSYIKCVLPVRSDDALSNTVSYLVENVPVVCTADEELILKDNEQHL